MFISMIFGNLTCPLLMFLGICVALSDMDCVIKEDQDWIKCCTFMDLLTHNNLEIYIVEYL